MGEDREGDGFLRVDVDAEFGRGADAQLGNESREIGHHRAIVCASACDDDLLQRHPCKAVEADRDGGRRQARSRSRSGQATGSPGGSQFIDELAAVLFASRALRGLQAVERIREDPVQETLVELAAGRDGAPLRSYLAAARVALDQ